MAIEYKSNSKQLWSEVMQLLGKDLIRRPKRIEIKTKEKFFFSFLVFVFSFFH